MISLRVEKTGRILGTISYQDARILRASLESVADSGYFIDSATLDLLKAQGLTDAALAALHTAIGSRDGVTVTLEGTDPDEPEPTGGERGQVAFVADQPLKCVVCHHDRFRHRRAQLHSASASFFNLEWLGPTADCYICSNCGHVHWFIPPV